MRTPAPWLLPILAAVVAGCGGGSPGPSTAAPEPDRTSGSTTTVAPEPEAFVAHVDDLCATLDGHIAPLRVAAAAAAAARDHDALADVYEQRIESMLRDVPLSKVDPPARDWTAFARFAAALKREQSALVELVDALRSHDDRKARARAALVRTQQAGRVQAARRLGAARCGRAERVRVAGR
jgi:hypothetical protein